ncbi:hypothetical protein BASA81_001485 [Batrachochytrium salamandrivorans]|nr:hypothetical protein BASA81_001485 [Batrachochytrium salamandrivorans]
MLASSLTNSMGIRRQTEVRAFSPTAKHNTQILVSGKTARCSSSRTCLWYSSSSWDCKYSASNSPITLRGTLVRILVSTSSSTQVKNQKSLTWQPKHTSKLHARHPSSLACCGTPKAQTSQVNHACGAANDSMSCPSKHVPKTTASPLLLRRKRRCRSLRSSATGPA